MGLNEALEWEQSENRNRPFKEMIKDLGKLEQDVLELINKFEIKHNRYMVSGKIESMSESPDFGTELVISKSCKLVAQVKR